MLVIYTVVIDIENFILIRHVNKIITLTLESFLPNIKTYKLTLKTTYVMHYITNSNSVTI